MRNVAGCEAVERIDGDIASLSGIAKVLRVRTTAEGIETQEQLRLVKALGCTEVQGYLFGTPMPVGELLRLFPAAAAGRATAA